MNKQIIKGFRFAAVATRNWKRADEPIYHQIFWDALNGKDRHECEEYTQVDEAKRYFEGRRDA